MALAVPPPWQGPAVLDLGRGTRGGLSLLRGVRPHAVGFAFYLDTEWGRSSPWPRTQRPPGLRVGLVAADSGPSPMQSEAGVTLAPMWQRARQHLSLPPKSSFYG